MQPINKSKFLKDYVEPNFLIPKTKLHIEIHDEYVIVEARLTIAKQTNSEKMVLDGVELELLYIEIDGKELSGRDFEIKEDVLIIQKEALQESGKEFELYTKVKIYPAKNTVLSGMYISNGIVCSQCESEGFRRITYYFDRPDVLSKFDVTISANKKLNTILAGGNLVSSMEKDNMTINRFVDPYKRPCYLFAVVVGNLSNIRQEFTTSSGKKVSIYVHSSKQNIDKCDFAMSVINSSMSWDEKVYGNEYDLEAFHAVAIDDFNSGAMENKGLNLFNSQAILAHPSTTTDEQYIRIEAIIAHEYFHNYSGNRVTCRDWFQLSLKEGFTVFREAQYMMDKYSHFARRLEDVIFLRSTQFAEDGGKLAHAVRPESYEQISNFYTATVYEKGAEVIGMLFYMLGEKKFFQACKLYFKKYDQQAVRVEEFIGCMEEVGKIDLSQFMLWYSQAGTPFVDIEVEYDENKKIAKIHTKQSCRETVECKIKKPYLIPMNLELMDSAGKNIYSGCVNLDSEINFFEVASKSTPVVSAFGDFSAPVNWSVSQSKSSLTSDEELVILATKSQDMFSRFDNFCKVSIDAICYKKTNVLTEVFGSYFDEMDIYSGITWKSFLAMVDVKTILLANSSKSGFLQENQLDLAKLFLNREHITQEIGGSFEGKMTEVFQKCLRYFDKSNLNNRTQHKDINVRAIKYEVLKYLLASKSIDLQYVYEGFKNSTNMTDSYKSLQFILEYGGDEMTDKCLQEFYIQHKQDTVCLTKYFSIQASSKKANSEFIQRLMEHRSFIKGNPNFIRATLGCYANNYKEFHNIDKSGYEFFAHKVLEIDSKNPQLAARVVIPLTEYGIFDTKRSVAMKEQLLYIKGRKNSKILSEIIDKSLS